MIRSFAVLVLSVLFFCACAPKYQQVVTSQNIHHETAPDYSSLDYWAAHPAKHDPSDSIPQPLRDEYSYDSTIDVFFIHPTTFIDQKDQRWNADMGDAALNRKTDFSTILFQASVFNEARVFAPRYRQANLKSYFTDDTSHAKEAFDLAYEDVKVAFQYYLEHFNNGHPIVIASHSQGSTHAVRLLREFFDQQPLSEKLIVAYVVGMNIPPDAFQQLKPCTDSISIGCFCGWRTFKRETEPFIQSRYKQSFVTNPLTWVTTDEYADAKLNKGGVLRNFNKIFPHVTDAQIHESILWSSKPKFPGAFLYTASNYHIGDINLFYLNIRENVQTRILHYKATRFAAYHQTNRIFHL